VELRTHDGLQPPATLFADEGAFRQIVINLLDNAVKHGPSGQVIDVSVERHDRWLRIRVDDSGPGVPADARERIFRPYERLNGGATGSGIGLAIVRDLIEAHGGRSGVEPRPGGGARFYVDFPDIAMATS
jgi:signal transduction histidine kinase